MKNKIKRFTSILLAFVITFISLSAGVCKIESCANAPTKKYSNYIEGMFSYYLDDETHCASLNSCNSSISGKGLIPSLIKEYKVTAIGPLAFEGCKGLTSITIPNSVTSIGLGAFSGCTGLTSITIPDNITSIEQGAFYDTDYYNNSKNWENNILYLGKYLIEAKNTITGEYKVKDGTKVIAEYAFGLCEGLTNITIPSSVTSIGPIAFEGCKGLTSITIPASVTSISGIAFSGCTSLTSITVDKNNKVYDSRNNCNAIIETAKNRLIYGCKNTIIPSSVTSIGNEAFYGCEGIKSIDIPNSVTSIGDGAFNWCTGLTNITIPNSITSIGDEAFYGCRNLTSITIPNSVTSIGSSAFEYCSGLTSIMIGNSVKTIGDDAFYACTGLTDVYYSGTKEQWNKISIGEGNDCLTKANIHFVTDSLGNINADEKINSTDALLVLQYSVGQITLTDEQLKCADVTNDGLVNSNDALKILQYAVGQIDKF